MNMPMDGMRAAALAVIVALVGAASAGAQTPDDEVILLPYPDRIQPLKSPVNAAIRYGTPAERKFVTDITWGPEKAPGLYNMNATGTLRIKRGKDGPLVEIERGDTRFTLGPKVTQRPGAGTITAPITALGRYKKIELAIPKLDSAAHRRQFAVLGRGLIDGGAIPPFRRLAKRTGPDDTGGTAEGRREKDARADLLEALQPLLGFVLPMPAGGLSSGKRLVVLRRDLGDLFRDAGQVPLNVEGTVAGIAEIDNRRFLALRLDRAEMPPPMRAHVEGHALIDLETGLPETVVATIELIVLKDTDAIAFRFVERRALLPDAVE